MMNSRCHLALPCLAIVSLPLYLGCDSGRLDDLEARINKSIQEQKESLTQLEDSRKENRKLEAAMSTKLEAFARESEGIARFQQEIKEDLQKFRDGYDPSMHVRLQEHLNASQKVSEFLATSRSEIDATLTQLQSHLERLRSDANSASDQHRKELDTLLATAKDLVEKCKEHETSAKNLDVMGSLEENIDRISNEIKGTKAEILGLNSKIDSNTLATSTFKNELTMLQISLRQLESQVRSNSINRR